MFLTMKKRNTLFMGVFAAFLTGMIFIAGCSDTVTPTSTKSNPDVRSFDSLYIAETISAASFSGMDLYNGKTVLRDDAAKDVQLIDTAGSGTGFYLRSGDLSVNDLVGTATRFQRIYSDMTQAQFDTITTFPVGHDPIVSSDFTSDDSRGGSSIAWGYFDGLSTRPVYCVWLKGKHDNGTTVFNDYAIIQPQSISSGGPLGTSMVFRVRVNVAGKNDFRKIIPAN